MKRILPIILVLSLLILSVPAVCSSELEVSAEAAVLYCPDNGEVYYSKNENKCMKPASTTKVMTALITLEIARKNNRRVKFTDKMAAEGSSMYLRAGEVVTLRDLALGMLLCSGNDAANAAAIAIDGSAEKFARRMNRRARQIGMKHTHFVTPSGLDDENHYTTAYDMALLMSEAMRNRDFARLTARRTATVRFIKPASKRTTYSNHNRLLSSYGYCTGGKTGYTMAAGRCLVSSAYKNGLRLIAVTLNDRDDWDDHIAMYECGFARYCGVELDDRDFLLNISSACAGEPDVSAVCDERCKVVVPADKAAKITREIRAENFVYTPVADGSVLGSIVYLLDGRKIAEHKLIAYTG